MNSPETPAPHAAAPRADAALARALAQPVLFGKPNRAALASCALPAGRRVVRVGVHRNHAIEPVVSACAPYAAWNDLDYRWLIGDYDDSLSLAAVPEADVHVLWLDTTRIRLQEDALAAWLGARIEALRARTDRPIVVAAWPLSVSQGAALGALALRDVHVADVEPLAQVMGAAWLDARTAALSGTSLSNRACLHLARELACRWLPAAVLSPVKCIAVDLDGTLYEGVLGEDGIAGVRLGEAHVALQRRLAQLREEGMLLALVSRNERADAEALFAARVDFPLRWADFSAIEVSWDDKARGIERAASHLRIATDACVFVDDNPGELASVASRLPATTVHARPDAGETLSALDHVAGIFRWTRSSADALRAGDLRASGERDAMRSAAGSDEDYLRSLEARVTFYVGADAHVARMAELARKTNQWNLALRRMSESEIAQSIAADPRNGVAFSLSDRLSDSGVVGALVGEVDGATLHVREASVSCRALGRSIEDVMLTWALRLMAEGRGVDRIRFDVVKGPRNGPARDWLARFSARPLADDAKFVEIDMRDVAGRVLPDTVAVVVEDREVTP
ncbi:MAG: HAD-IIIC family phosphatase [Burkholderiales bacterium]